MKINYLLLSITLFIILNNFVMAQEIDTLALFPDTTTFNDPLIILEDVYNAAVKFEVDGPEEYYLKSVLFIRNQEVLLDHLRLSVGEYPEQEVIYDTTFQSTPKYPEWNELVLMPSVKINSPHFFISVLPIILQTYVHWDDSTILNQYYFYVDRWFEGHSGYFAIKAVIDKKLSDVQENQLNPNEFELYQNYPNPFNPETKIKFSTSRPGLVNLAVSDLLGREVETLVNEYRNSGTFETTFNSKNLASGIYIYRLKAGDKVFSKKMILMK